MTCNVTALEAETLEHATGNVDELCIDLFLIGRKHVFAKQFFLLFY